MGIEIERKFLVSGEDWKSLGTPILYKQGYLNKSPERTVRVRIAGETAFLTIKGKGKGISRPEFEYQIPVEEADQLLNELCLHPLIEKFRWKIPFKGFLWEVDEFLGDNKGLILAEVELEDADVDPPLPNWIGKEVSHDPRYFNSNLSDHPYQEWS